MELDKFIIYGTTGALLLSAIYHSLLYYNRRERILLDYCLYLCACFVSGLIAILAINKVGLSASASYITGTSVTFYSYILYFKFAGTAFNIRKEHHRSGWLLIRVIYVLVVLYLLVLTVSELYLTRYNPVERILFNVVGSLMCTGGLYLSITHFRINKSAFIRQMLLGASFLCISSIYYIVYTYLHPNAGFSNTFAIVCVSYFVETVFYSIALATKMNMDLQEKISATQKMNEFQQLLLNVELDKQSEIIDNRRKERVLIAGDMHDELSNALAGLRFYIADMRLKATEAGTENILKAVEEEAESVYRQARSFMHRLHNSFDDRNFDLTGFLASLSVHFKDSSLSVLVTAHAGSIMERLDMRQQNQLYLVIRESLSNIMKYAEATRVEIDIHFTAHQCRLYIRDNGKGFPEIVSKGLGLQNMEERIRGLQGTMTIESTPGGTTVFAEFPCVSH